MQLYRNSIMFLARTCYLRPSGRSFMKNVSSSAGYTKEERTHLLELINKSNETNLPSKLIGDSNASKIRSHLQAVGHISRLEDLLKVQGLGPRTLKKICDKLLDKKDDPETVQEEFTTRKKRAIPSLTTPLLGSKQIDEISTLVAFQIDSNLLSWAKLNAKMKSLLSWDVMDLPVDIKKSTVPTLLELAKYIKSKLPEGDIYVFEDVPSNSANGQLSMGSLFKVQLVAMLVTLLDLSKSDPESNCPTSVFLKYQISARIFNRVVGTERTSAQSIVEDFLQESNSPDFSNVYVGPELRALYNGQKPAHKENLSESLLHAISFMDLVIYNKSDLLDRKKTVKNKFV